MRGARAVLLALALAVPAMARAADAEKPELDASVHAALAAAREDPTSAAAIAGLVDACVTAHGDVGPLVDELTRLLGDESIASGDRKSTELVQLDVLHRRGDIRQARKLADQMIKEDDDPALALRRARLLDALGRGKLAKTAYEEVLPRLTDDEQITTVRLRLALLNREELGGGASSGTRRSGMMIIMSSGGSVRGGANKRLSRPPPESGAALAEFADRDGLDVALRNRAAAVLGMLGHPDRAADLLVPTGDARNRFRQAIRRAEWAVSARSWDRAKELAWAALDAARFRRDRVYALSVLVEAHRGGGALQELVDRFAAMETVKDDVRRTWIDALREIGNVKEALRLFRQSTGGSFTAPMRRELLELCRQSGDDAVLRDAYDELVDAEPARVEWREGLARFHLERGDREAAAAAFRDRAPDPEDATYRLAAAGATSSLGLHDLAMELLERCVEDGDGRYEALIFQSDLHRRRGDFKESEAALDRMDEMAPPDEAARMQLSDAFEQLGRLDRAVEVIEKVVESRGADSAGEDLSMRLAWLHSELGNEEDALVAWRELWERVDSIARRRYVEDRLMTVASRLGTLADIVVELEERLAAGDADPRASGLLIRIYTRVADAVSAAEVIDEFMKLTGGDEIKALNEKSFVYLACTDYRNYEATIEELLERDPENTGEYLQQLAMSKLERGRLDQARGVLERLRKVEDPGVGAEFEAGVLAMAGLRKEAAHAYRRAVVGRPDHIDVYLLLGKTLKELGQQERAVGMFQYLVEHAERDDLFTIAVDGLLNLEAPPHVLKWARRVTYERLASRHDKTYLYQLVADLSEELNDFDSMIRAHAASLPIAGERRTSLLRELMDLCGQQNYQSLRLRYGRRLLGTDEVVPPQVYLDLGEAFLGAGDAAGAAKTFARAADLPDQGGFQRKVADSFQRRRYLTRALDVYRRVLVGEADDVAVLVKVAELCEQLGTDEEAHDTWGRIVDLLLRRRPLSVVKGKEEEVDDRNPWAAWYAKNVDAFDEHFDSAAAGLLATLPDDAAGLALAAAAATDVRADLARLAAEAPDDAEAEITLDTYPRVRDRAAFVRRVATACGDPAVADDLDLALLAALRDDEKLLETLCRGRLEQGLIASARRLVKESVQPEERKAALRYLVGLGSSEAAPGRVPVKEAVGLLLPLLRDGKTDQLVTLLRQVDIDAAGKDELDAFAPLLWTSILLEDVDLTLRMGRRWVRVAAKHAPQHEVTGIVDLILSRTSRLLNTAQHRSLADALITHIADDPEKNSGLVSALPGIQERFEEPLLTTEQALEFIAAMAEKRSWGMGAVLSLIEENEALSALRTAVDKTPENQRAVVMPQLIGGLEIAADEDLAAFAVATFERSLDDVQDEWYLRYLLQNSPVQNGENLPIFLRFAEVLVEKKPEIEQNSVALAQTLHALGRTDEALDIAAEQYRKLARAGTQDWQKNSARSMLTMTFLPDHRDRFEAVLDDMEEQEGKDAILALRRIELFQSGATRLQMLDALRTAHEKHPKDEQIRTRYVQQLRSVGRRRHVIGVLGAALEREPSNRQLEQQIVSEWRSMDHPVKALAEQERFAAAHADGDEDELAPRGPDERAPLPTISEMKKALEAGDEETVRTIYRRMWRQFGTNSRFISMYRTNRIENMWWPVARTQDGPPPRGGLEGFDDLRETEPFVRTSAHDVLAEHEFGRDELRRIVRTLEGRDVDTVPSVHKALVTSSAKGDTAGAVARLVNLVRSGKGGRIENALLLELLAEHPESAGADAREVLDELTANVSPDDGAAIRRLARIHAKLGDAGGAKRLYRYCAHLSTAGYSWGVQRYVPIQARELVDDVLENVTGEALAEVLDTLMRTADPGPKHWGRDGFEMLVLDTWEKAFDADTALRRGAHIVENVRDTEHAYKRGTARAAAYLLARAGRTDEAMACLEFAICRPEETAESLTLPAWERQRRFMGITLNTNDVRRMFPAPGGDWQPSPAWLSRSADALAQWIGEERTERDRMFTGLVVMSARLHAAGDSARAAKLATLAAETAEGDGNRSLWMVDLHRRRGDEASARKLEDGLVSGGGLYVHRLAGILDRVAQEEGVDTALERADSILEWSGNKTVREAIQELARKAGRDEHVLRLEAQATEYESAKKALEAK